MEWPPPNYRPEYGSGYRMKFREFRSLTTEPSIVPLLHQWFGDEDIDLQSMHDRIQSDPQKQYVLYQRAMDIWR